MKKIILLVLVLAMAFAVSGMVVSGQIACGPTPLGNLGCLPTTISCGFGQCSGNYNTCDGTASATCLGETAICLATFNECVGSCPECPCEPKYYTCLETAFTKYKGEQLTCIGVANALQTNIINGGDYSALPCTEMNHCYLSIGSLLKSPKTLSCAGISKEAYINVITKFGAEYGSEIAWNTPLDILADERIKEAMVNAGMKIPSLRSTQLIAYELFNNVYNGVSYLTDNPLTNLVGKLKGAYEFVKGFFAGGADQSAYNKANTPAPYYDTTPSAGYISQILCPPRYTPVSGKYNSGNPECIKDNIGGASQSIASLTTNNEIGFGSIHVIDKKKNNMFSLTGADNTGVVYQSDGFVNIDKGGTTKISVAGEGAYITDYHNNQLYLGGGTTTYFGTGNDDNDIYLTNALILDANSKVAVDALNPKEQKRLEQAPNPNLKQNIELALTIDKYNLKPYKNSVDIGKLEDQHQILTRGFSDIALLGADKVFPFVTRNNAKGDALIVRNKDVEIEEPYIVRDENYEYLIKTIGYSTKVINQNKKIIQDSGSLASGLSKRQSLLIYGS